MNTNLLQITNIPISIEVNVTNPSLRTPATSSPKMNISKTESGYKIDAQPAKINIDTYDARASMGYGEYNSADFVSTEANKGIKLAYKGVAKIVQDGNSLMQGISPSEIASQKSRAGASIETVMEFLPKTGADVTFDKGTLNIQYEASATSIDWENLQAKPLEFTPGTIEFIVKERPRVEIEYLGEPIYVPPSANPSYRASKLNTKG